MALNGPYSLMAFDSVAAPSSHADFLAWFREQMECNEDHAYEDPTEASEPLRNWLLEMQQVFPSGADASNNDLLPDTDEDFYSGYSIGRRMIYVIFVHSVAGSARSLSFELAAKYGLGIFEPTTETQDLWRPSVGSLVPTFRRGWRKRSPPSLKNSWGRWLRAVSCQSHVYRVG